MTRNIWKYFKVVFIIMFYLLYGFLLTYLLKYFKIDIKSFSKQTYLIFLLLSDLFLIFILSLIYRKDLKENIIDYKNNFKEYIAFGMKWWILGCAIMIISNLVIAWYNPGGAANQNLVESYAKMAPIYMFISSVIMAPFIEEIIFRKSIREIFSNDFLYILVCGLLFGYIHTLAGSSTTELVYIIPYGALGGVFAYMYTKTKNIFVPITFHFLHNGILLIFYIISMLGASLWVLD